LLGRVRTDHIKDSSDSRTSNLPILSILNPKPYLQAAYYALFKLGRFGFYLLVPGHTNAYSLLTNALLMCRFAPPLAFNFMAALAMPASKHDERFDVTETVRHPSPVCTRPPPPPRGRASAATLSSHLEM